MRAVFGVSEDRDGRSLSNAPIKRDRSVIILEISFRESPIHSGCILRDYFIVEVCDGTPLLGGPVGKVGRQGC